MLPWISLGILCYLVGSISPAYLVGRLRYGVDIRDLGDRNPSAANVWRSLGPRPGIAVGFIDTGKGALCVLIARLFEDTVEAAMLGGLLALAGHIFPVFIGFRGGRGAATLMGVFLAMAPLVTPILVFLSGLMMLRTRSTTVFFFFLFSLFPLGAWVTDAPATVISYAVGMAILVGVAHLLTAKRAARLEPRALLKDEIEFRES